MEYDIEEDDKVTLNDIAKLANVSRGTVDRAINNRKGISAKTRDKIITMINELNYKKNNVGKALALQNKMNLGIIVPADITPQDNMLFIQAIEGMKNAAKYYGEFGVKVEIRQMQYSTVDEIEESIRYFIKNRVIGLAIMPVVVDGKNIAKIAVAIDDAVKENISVITVYSDVPDSKRRIFIGNDFTRVGRLGGEYLCKSIGGQGSISVFSGFENNLVHKTKVISFMEKVKESFPDVDLTGIYYNNYSKEIAFETCMKVMNEHPNIKGVAVSCGGMEGIVDALKYRNLIKKVKMLVFEITPKAMELLKKDEIDAIIGIDLKEQGYSAVKTLYDLTFNKLGNSEKILSRIDILLKESL